MTLDKLLIQVRRIAEHRQLGAEKQIRAAYKRTLNDLKKFIGYEFAQYAEDGKLTYDILAKKQSTARFLEEVQQNIDGLSPETQAEILQCVSDIYELSYEGMTNAALKTAPKAAAVALQGLSFVQPTQVRGGVNNELINKITLNDVLEKNRRNVIYDLKRAVTIGITNGETVDMMSRRVSGVLDGDYKKAVRVVRTEAHRVREMGLSDSAKSFDEELQKTDTGLRMVKIWRTMKDERVRPNRRYKTKKGWRTSVGSGANHQKMEGQTVLATDMFELTDGHMTVAPGQSGIAAQDINCRCFVQYKLVDNAEFVKLSAKNKFTNGDNSGIIKAGSAKSMRINNIDSPIEQRNTAKGNPNAILQIGRPLNNRQKKILENLDKYDSRVIVNKKTVNMKDLSALTAYTGDEFAMFTKGGERLVIRGNSSSVNIDIEKAIELNKRGYKWSGHTHPGVDWNSSMPSGGDKEILRCFKQETSVIYDSKGKYRTFEKE